MILVKVIKMRLDHSALPTNVRLEEPCCPLGCPPNDEHVLTGRDRISNIPGEFPVVRCRTCGLMRTSPRPTADTIGAYYPPSYGPYAYTRAGSGSAKTKPAPRRTRLRTLGSRIVDSNAFALPGLKPGHALELGCASGSFMSYLESQGWSVEGVEPGAEAADCARTRGYRVQTCSVEDMAPPERPPALIVGWMVLEHMHDPLRALRRIAQWSPTDARLVLSVPNADSLPAKIFGTEWYALHLPCHLWHFTPATLRQLLANAGWNLDRVLHQRVLGDYLSSAGNWAETLGASDAGTWLRRTAKKRKTFLAGYPLAVLLAQLGETGRMTVWATRAST